LNNAFLDHCRESCRLHLPPRKKNINIVRVIFCLCRRKNTIALTRPDGGLLTETEEVMDEESENAALGNTGVVAGIEGGNPAHINAREGTASAAASTAKRDFGDPAKQRREKIKKLEARLQREIARDSAATRKERNGQLFVWGAMVEAIYRDGDDQERDRLRRWAKRKLTDKRHLQRAENGFARIEDEAVDTSDS
jgi:hypothetical protein